MPEISVDHLGQIGIVRDLAKYRLQPNAWSDGRNVTFDDDKVRRVQGSFPLWEGLGLSPLQVLFQRTVNENYWLVAGTTAVKVWNGSAWSDITRATPYNANRAIGWNGGVFGGISILNNGVDAPQYWQGADVGLNLQDITAWPANTRARIIRPFGSFLIAGYITKENKVYEHMIKWSHRADPGALPVSWDHTDPTLDAGETNLIDTSAGPILDLAQLGDSMFVYKVGAIWEITRLRDFNIFDFKSRFEGAGILSTNCVTQVPRQRYNFLMTGDDLAIHNGQEMQSVVDKRWRRWLSENMAFDAASTAFVVSNPFNNECWFCFPEVSAEWCTKALIWNYVENTIGVRDLDNISCGGTGLIIAVDDSWDTAFGDWNSDSEIWNIQNFDPRRNTILLGDVLNSRVLHGAFGNQIADADIEASVERKALAIVGKDLQGNPVADHSVIKQIQRLWLKGSGAPFMVELGAHDEEDGDVQWDLPQHFDPARDQYVDPISPPNGRYLAIRISSNSGDPWQLEGYKLEFETLGNF